MYRSRLAVTRSRAYYEYRIVHGLIQKLPQARTLQIRNALLKSARITVEVLHLRHKYDFPPNCYAGSAKFKLLFGGRKHIILTRLRRIATNPYGKLLKLQTLRYVPLDEMLIYLWNVRANPCVRPFGRTIMSAPTLLSVRSQAFILGFTGLAI